MAEYGAREWGRPPWGLGLAGDADIDYDAAVSVEAILDSSYSARITAESSPESVYSAKITPEITPDLSYSAEVLAVNYALGESDYAASVHVARWNTMSYLKAAPPPLQILVEVDWPGGSRRYAGSDVAVETTGYDGRLLAMGSFTLGVDGRKSTVSVDLENLDSPGASIESLWSDANPPEGATVRLYFHFQGETLAQRMLLFEGVVEEVQEVRDDLVRFTAVSFEGHDKLLGVEVSTTLFPDAPEESLGRMQPIVFGTVEDLETIPVTQIGSSALAGTLLAAETTVPLEDAEDFPTSGTVVIGDEEITYTGKTGNNLTGATRGANGTAATNYGSGVPVIEKGTAEYLMSVHALADLTKVVAYRGVRKRVVPVSEFTEDLTAPASISFAGGPPRVPVASGTTAFSQIQVDSAGASNTALTPELAAMDADGWTPRNFAEISETNDTLELVQDDPVEPPGEIVRAWMVVEFDNRDLSEVLLQGDSITAKFDGNTLGALVLGGNLPSDLKNRAELTLSRAYDDEHDHDVSAAGSPTTLTKTPATVTWSPATFSARPTPWNWAPANPPTNTRDGSDSSSSTLDADDSSDPGAWPSTGSLGSLKYTSWSYTPTSGKQLKSFRARAKLGKDVNPDAYKGALRLQLFVDGSLHSEVTQSHGAAASAVFTSAFTTSDANKVNNAEVRVNPLGGNLAIQIGDGYRVWEVDIEVTEEPTIGDTSTEGPMEHTRTHLFEITSLVTDWPDFDDVVAQVIFNGDSSSTKRLRIIRLFYLVEFSPYVLEPADRVLVDVQGIIPDGGPIDILRQILTHANLLGLPASIYNAGTLLAAEALLDAIPYALDFAVLEKIQASELIAKVCAQSRLRWWWEQGQLYVAFRPSIAGMGAPTTTYTVDDVIPDSIVRARTVLRDVVTKLEARYRYSGEHDDLTGSVTQTQAPTALIGERPGVVDLDLVRDDSVAQNFATWSVERTAKPRYRVTFTTYLPGLGPSPTEVIALVTERLNLQKLEVVEIAITETTVTFTCFSWE